LQKWLVPNGMGNNPNKNMESIKYITIHETGNYKPLANAKFHAEYQYTGTEGRLASWHYSVDKDGVWQSFEDARMCWHAGDGKGPGNSNSIAIEICVNDKSEFARACDIASQLTADLLKKHKLSVSDIRQHNYWSGKDCPYELRSGSWGITWDGLINNIKKYTSAPAAQSGTPITGKPELTAEQLTEFLTKNNPAPKISTTAAELTRLFIDVGKMLNIRGDMAFCQSALETNWFRYGGLVQPEQNNYCGLGASGGEWTGAWFQTPEEGVMAQIQHLFAYAVKDPLPDVIVNYDVRFKLVTRGSAPCWEDLGGKWAFPGYDPKLYKECNRGESGEGLLWR